MNIVGPQGSEKHRDTLDSSISKMLSEIKKDREEQRRLMEYLMKKIERPARSVQPRMERVSPWGPRNTGGGNCWSCGEPGHFSHNCPNVRYNQGNEGVPNQRA